MTFLQALLLGIIQGIAEFLPISSSGHLVLFESIFGLEIETLKGFDVVLHLGTLVAIVIYFWNDLWGLFKNRRLLGYIVLATIPAVIVGFTMEDWLDYVFRDPKMVLLMLALLAVFFVIAEKYPPKKERWRFTLKNTFLMGIAQACALIPGISRSGSVIGTGLLFGLKREEAARFAFLLGTPAIAGASLLTGIHVVQGEAPLPSWDLVIVGFFASAVAGYLSVSFLMKFLKTHSLRVFSIYLVVAAVIGIIVLN
ncbi:undecaprenyl-diphosphate phosphatase [Candidatus Peregrinibacteria bacterium]|jgi:undecaprenyl-diphosphatase|nr:undecaprenyl-diphosphate phosphatase [Candidatus Peregrinibacteria bacterium]MBT7483570.1 undecaprenyl-diphosphate phosphatase [Candidatus Peregrinibacteria bacterium]MBT7703222.1 undecaprenyl-diphosphate phosphatase [Candidatus Peregrinibacteria bacterium]